MRLGVVDHSRALFSCSERKGPERPEHELHLPHLWWCDELVAAVVRSRCEKVVQGTEDQCGASDSYAGSRRPRDEDQSSRRIHDGEESLSVAYGQSFGSATAVYVSIVGRHSGHLFFLWDLSGAMPAGLSTFGSHGVGDTE